MAVDIPWSKYKVNRSSFNAKFIKAWSVLLDVPQSQIVIMSLQNTTSGTKVVCFFDLQLPVLPSTSDSSTTGGSVISTKGYHNVAYFFTSYEAGAPALPIVIVEMQRQGLPLTGAWYIDIFVDAPPPPFSPPIGMWKLGDFGEAVALDIPFADFESKVEQYGSGFLLAMGKLLRLPLAAITIHDTQPSSANTTIVYFDISAASTDSSSSAIIHAANGLVASLFASGAAQTPGAPANASVVAAFRAAGLPVLNMFYLDQFEETGNKALPSAFYASTFNVLGLAVALDIPFAEYAANALSYGNAFVAGMSANLGVLTETLVVTDFQISSAGTTIIFFRTLISATSSSEDVLSSDAIPVANLAFQALFSSTAVGAVGNPGIVTMLQEYGLPATAVYLNDQPAAQTTTTNRKLMLF